MWQTKIFLGELVESGHLVKPRTFVIKLGEEADQKLKDLYWNSRGHRWANPSENQMLTSASEILNTPKYNEEVFRHWQEKAGGRKTVVFCSTVAHAQDIQSTFNYHGIPTGHINGQLHDKERLTTLQSFQEGDLRVLTNVAVLTEGWDCPEVSCVILLRPSSYKSTMIQMVGRGLRPFEGKEDCLILDFGLSSKVYGSLEQDVNLSSAGERVEQKDKEEEEEEKKTQDVGPARDLNHSLEMKEIDMLNQRPSAPLKKHFKNSFYWIEHPQDDAYIAHSPDGTCMVVRYGESDFNCFVKERGETLECIFTACDREEGFEIGAEALKERGIRQFKGGAWKYEPPTDKQLKYIPGSIVPENRYEACALLSYEFSKKEMKDSFF
jgi:DNA repair protein RadD